MLLDVRDLELELSAQDRWVKILRKVNIRFESGETVGILGPSGSGKSMLGLTISGMLESGNEVRVNGTIRYHIDGRDFELNRMDKKARWDFSKRNISFVLQNPVSATNPIRRVGTQLEDVIRANHADDGRTMKSLMDKALEQVQLDQIPGIQRRYPFQLSGGQLQRAVIAMAIAKSPRLLITDEPTSSLDAHLKYDLLDLIGQLRDKRGFTWILITHDERLLEKYCDRYYRMSDGQIRPLEKLTVRAAPSVIDQGAAPAPPSVDGGIEFENVAVSYRLGSFFFRRKKDVLRGLQTSLSLHDITGIVGASGSGKTSLGKAIVRLAGLSRGQITIDGESLSTLSRHQLSRKVQMVFQDPYSSLNPRMPVSEVLAEALQLAGIKKAEIRKRSVELLEKTGLEASHLSRYPNQFSGGQRQRVAIARALALSPEFLICDECISSLDYEAQQKIIGLLSGLHRQAGLGILFISHDLEAVRQIATRIIVLDKGKICEDMPAQKIFDSKNPATLQLLRSFYRL